MAAFQRFGNPPLCVNDFVEIFLPPTEKLGVGKRRRRKMGNGKSEMRIKN
jgi:hypothetical protein